MKLLTFLGVSNYQETVYTWREQEYKSRFAPAASCHFLKPEKIIVFLTEDAEQQIFPDFQAALPPGLGVQPVPVPLGQDETELWQIFNQISSSVQPGEQVAFDITHGLRSFPLIGLMAAAFLRSGLNIELCAVLYGAYDVGALTSEGRTPMFDLTGMITLLEWSSAADRFTRTGDSRYLASLVKSQRKNMALAAGDDRETLEQVGRLGNLAGALTGISQSLRLIRPHLVMQQADELEHRVEKAKPALAGTASARPFELVLDSVVAAYQPLALSDPSSADQVQSYLETARVMIRWYVEREQWVQAVSLAREWLVSWLMVQLGISSLTNQAARRRVEFVVGAEADDYLSAKQDGQDFSPIFLGNIPDIENLLSFWLTFTNVRNDIDHAGMRETPGNPEDLIAQIKAGIQVIEALPL